MAGETHFISVHKSLSEIDFLKVWKIDEAFDPILLRRIQLKRIQNKLVFSTIFGDQSIVLVDQLARISILNISDGKLIYERDYKGAINGSIHIDRDEEALFLGYTRSKDHQKKILQLQLPDLELINEISLPEKAIFNPFWVLSPSKIYVYFQAGGDLNRGVHDGLYVVDLINQTVHSSTFSPASKTFDLQPPITISAGFNMGARTDYSNIEIRATSGRKRYLAKLQIFNLDNCDPIKTIELREFLPEHVFEDIDPTLALSNLELPSEEEAYQDSQSEFLERITSIKFCHHERALWVGFQHGLIRKIHLDDREYSPLFAYPSKNLSETSDPYLMAGFDNPIVLSEDDEQIGFGSPRIDVSIKNLELDSKLSLIPLPDKLRERSIYVTSNKDYNVVSWNTFEIAHKSLLDVLKEITEKLTHGTLTIDGSYLRIRCRNENGILSEKEFFQQLVDEPKWEQLTEQYLLKLIEQNEPFYSEHLIPVGFYAISSLIDRSNNYGKLLNRYLSSNIIPEGCALRELSTAINMASPWSWLKLELLLNYSTYPESSGFDQLQEALKTTDFLQFINSKKIKSLFQNHPLIVELGDDLFHLLHPLEDQLFEAISWGQFSKIKDLVNQGVDLNSSHPDFKYSALMCAIEMDHDEISKFLVLHGANIENSDILE